MGILFYDNGNIQYKGNFMNDSFDGFGNYYYKNGNIYIGNMTKNKRNGEGVLYNKNNNIIYSGLWENDNPLKN